MIMAVEDYLDWASRCERDAQALQAVFASGDRKELSRAGAVRSRNWLCHNRHAYSDFQVYGMMYYEELGNVMYHVLACLLIRRNSPHPLEESYDILTGDSTNVGDLLEAIFGKVYYEVYPEQWPRARTHDLTGTSSWLELCYAMEMALHSIGEVLQELRISPQRTMAPRIAQRIENMIRDGTEARRRHMNLIWHLALVKQFNRHGVDDNIVDVIAGCLGFVRRN